MPTTALSPAPRPVIFIDGIEHVALSRDVERLVIEEALSSPARCTGRFANLTPSGRGFEFAYFGLQDVAFGRTLTVWQGIPPSTLIRMFEGRVHEVGGAYPAASPPAFVIGAEDGLAVFWRRQRTRMFEHMSDAQMIAELAAEHGLTTDIGLSGSLPVHAATAQLNQSDAAFLADRLAAIGAEMWIDQGVLVVTDSGDGAGQTLSYGQDLLACTVGADLSQQRTAVGVSGWDVHGKQVILATATAADLPADQAGAVSGPHVLDQTFGPAVEAFVDEVPATTDGARALAVAHLRASASAFITGRGLAIGAVALRAGRPVTLQGLGTLFSGAYQVTAVRHEFTLEHGWQTTFDVRRPRLGPAGTARRPEEMTHATRDPRPGSAAGSRARKSPARRSPSRRRR
ncbi:MAG TPA: contractile injection system protein, VgrG/Pvc8 family [Vicinamibacterales bacterium]|nr:contractile injection system protein, VgrG/Pvc8 family [Vicinamibacterales bacterium]